MSKQGATAGSWNHEPMSPEREEIVYREEFTQAEMEQIRLGYIPEVMEEKWFIYMEGDWLYLHRSWTGLCVYMIRFKQKGGGFLVVEAWASRDAKKRNWISSEHDARELASIIHLLLLDEYVRFPRKSGDSDEEAALGMWSLVGKEMMRGEREE